MIFETHLTIEVIDINKFKLDCLKLGVKPIFIQTENHSNELGDQIMTSSKHNDEYYLNTLNKLIFEFENNNYKILRKKVEIQPEETKHPEHIYYESHLRLKLPKDYNIDIIKELCIKSNFHLSKNLFKTDELYNYQMITYRNNFINYNTFQYIINKMIDILNKIDIGCDKIEIEECIFDSNINIDNNWLNK